MPRAPLMRWGVALLALALIWAASLTRPWHALEFKTFDLWSTLAAPGRGAPALVILAIDEPSLQQVGLPWPFPRSLHARLIDRLVQDGAAAIAFDVVFAEPSGDPAQDAALAAAIARATRAGVPLVLASAREQARNANALLWTEVAPLPQLLAAGARTGDAGVQPDEDFVVRRPPAGEDSFSASLARALGRDGGANAELIAYRGPRGSFDTRSYYQAVEPGLLPAGFFQGKVVLVGQALVAGGGSQGLQADTFNSPFGLLGGERLMPGVELQATLLDNRLQGDGLRIAPAAAGMVLVLLAAALLLGAGARWHPGATAALTAALVLGTLALSWWLFSRQRWWLAPLWPAASMLALYAATALTAWAAARRRARQTREMFAHYVPPEVVARLVEQPGLLHLGGEVREVTLLFTDLAGFTAMAERLSAEQTVEVLTAYFDAMTPLIHASGGTVDKYIGDAIMAFWGAPLADAAHAAHAVHAAVAMQQAMQPLAEHLRARGLPALRMRIGVHTGRVVVGNVGSRQRFAYTAIGDAVNLAARLEGANKAFGTGILVSAQTAARLPPDIALRPLDDVIVQGRSTPVRVFTPCADAEVCRLSRAALDALHARDAPSAQAHLAALLARLPSDRAAQRLAERARALAQLPADAPWSAAVALDKL
ncbi:adenylate/guanylate cyclase domain-containing protein [Comamonas flocculans]|uniref:Adenylate/guanylate cyclase domain-containing protein n=1 Tax=Comamonas flocculans TaxID=2597701 RepID=A0A5B8RX52_9BURK|nr:adenylate/guanylate cyclase domain-containing protein [Comamonas flocculans]QEA12387.1 adenylate/guanylate cyclase domain-containing protein [Comamonas flocculans]